MLTTILSHNTIYSDVVYSGVKSATTTIGIPQYWIVVIIGLLILLSLMEILVATEKWNRNINCSFNIAIIPLTFSFIGIIIFKIMEFI
ncbi:hypothetical protein MSBRW_0017 (plasmid) [Methanosarcina barkeri str. Wiesmoor]|uniref:Uncharacterized protein n=1 Tax=Methanosarcina barkeri str. Wiesmoor TaxID=1434109 RepID=A0A0E3QFR0_METBA|nr:hypothetical protein MSBRW_0017 [Methanosarcina barkeri str. Wiesmoor]